ncbi:MAG: protein TolR [Gammaproteobacteria bacterium]|nr:protein TolR [Gammaproteobacteria bacterium]
MRKRRGRMAEINVVPYIDVMLVLLVIFMITAPLLNQGVQVELPKAASQPLTSAEKEPLIVSVNSQGQYFLNISSAPSSPITEDDLMRDVAAELAKAKQENREQQVFVKGDHHVNYGSVVHAMVILQKAGAPRVGLLTQPSLD